MSINKFIGGSSALLLAWLGATYFHEVPAERYPTQGAPTSSTTSKVEVSEDTIVVANNPTASDFH